MKILNKINLKIIFIGMAVLLVLGACSTVHHGRYDPSIPLEDQCMLKISGNVYVYGFDGEDVNWRDSFWGKQHSIIIPAGYHYFNTRYTYTKNYQNYVSYYTYTLVTGYDDIEFFFEPGRTYNLQVWVGKDGGYVDIDEDFYDDEKLKTFYVIPEFHWLGIGFARDYGNSFKWDIMPIQLGAVIESAKLKTGLYWEFCYGLGFGVSSDEQYEANGTIGLPAYTGITVEFAKPGSNVSFGIGTGLISQFFFMAPTAPYLRASFIPYNKATKFVAYFDYYLPNISEYDSSYRVFTTNKWGLGFYWYFM